MSIKIHEEVKRKFDARFLAVAKYPQWVANIVSFRRRMEKCECVSIIGI